VSLFVDTSVWSLAFRRDHAVERPEIALLVRAIESGETVLTTGLVLQELLQGFVGPKDRPKIVERFAVLPLIVPTRDDHVAAAELRNHCRRNGVQVETIDALLAQLCIHYNATMLTADGDFTQMAKHSKLKVWSPR
jgi:predicted nucleic acid-binding protein